MKKPSVVCEVLFQAVVEIRVLCGFPSEAPVSIGLPFFLARFFSFCACFYFSHKNIAPGSPRNDDRLLGRPTASPVLSLRSSFATFFLFERSAEAIRLRTSLNDVRLVGQPVQHGLA